MSTKAETHILLGHGHELVLLAALVVDGVRDARGSEVDEAVRVKLVGVGVDGRVARHGAVGGLDGVARGQVDAVAEGYGLAYVAAEAGYIRHLGLVQYVVFVKCVVAYLG